MKKIGLISLLTLFVSVIIIGCGGNSKLDPIPPVPVSPYGFVNASTPLEISERDKDYNLSVQLTENGFGYPGQIVRMLPFDRTFGQVESESVETDTSGWAMFIYHSPENLSELGGQSLTLQAVYVDDDNTSVLIQDFVLNFATVPEGNLYHLTNQSTPIVVSLDMNSTTGVGGITKEISAYVVDKDNIGVPGQTVTIGILDQQFGSISPSSVLTDEAGKAIFTYATSDTIDSQIGNSTTVNINYTEYEVTESLPVTIEITACCGCPGGPSICP